MLKKTFLTWSAIVACCITLYLCYVAARTTEPRVTSWDNLGYYLYLPQTFIENDPGVHDLSALEKARQQYDLAPVLYQLHEAPTGNHITQYPLGMACFYLPGFITGHCLAKLTGAPADGYSPPYQYSQLWFSVICCIIGLWLLRKLLQRYFTDGTVAILLCIVFFGTNYFIYATTGFGTPHTYLFLALVTTLQLTICWHEKPSLRNSFALGSVLGLMTITRPTEILVCLIPLLWQVYSFRDLKNKIRLLFSGQFKYLLLMVAGFMVLPLLQMIYWKVYAGSFLYYSYRNPGEGFEFLHPHIFNFLFSFRKGWFVYTPLMLPALLLLFFGRKRTQPYQLAFVVFTCINIYVLSCWSNWWYATSFGQRAVIESYPVYLFGLGILFDRLKNHLAWRVLALSLTTVFCSLNLFQIWQVGHGILPLDRMTKDYYLATFGDTEQTWGIDSLLLVDRSVQLSDTLPHANWYKTAREFPAPQDTFSIQPTEAFGPVIFHLPYSAITSRNHAWINISLEIKLPDSLQNLPLPLAACFMNKRGEAYNWTCTNVMEKLSRGEKGWSRFSVYYLTPEVRLNSDKLNVQIENPGHGQFMIRHFRLETLERKVQH